MTQNTTLPSAQPVTLAEVARQAGVSPMTVSNVINNKVNVRPQTRQRVLDAIAQTGYRVNGVARALAGGKARLISVITRQINLPYVSEVLLGAVETAETLNYDLVVLMMGERNSGHLPLMSKLSAGALLVQPNRLSRLGPASLPQHVISIDGPGHLTLGVDNYGGARAAMQHLLHLGHTRIAFLTGLGATYYDPTRQCDVQDPDRDDGAERLRAYHDTMHEAGLAILPAYVQEGDYTKLSGERATQQLLELPERPTAIFASSDAMAIGAIHVAQNQGLRVPEDLSVVGFDDFAMASQSRPALTTIRQPLHDIGAVAVRLLISLAEGQPVTLPPPFATQLVVRESTAAAPGSSRAGLQ